MIQQIRFKTLLSFLSMFILFQSSTLLAQKAIYGNGTIQQDKRMVANFSQLNVSLNGTIIIHTGQQPHVIVETDENILKNVVTKVQGNVLVIDQKDWPEPSKKFIVHVYSPMITSIKTDSWANIKMLDIVQERLSLNLDEGSIIASGNVTNLSVISGQAKLDFTNLTTETVDVELNGYADMVLCCAETVKRKIKPGATFKLLSDPSQSDNAVSQEIKIEYVDFTLVNNKMTRGHFVVRGPKSKRFSYGFPLNPYFSKKERWPVGTKIYKETLLGSEVLLVEIKKADENQRVNLFK